MVKFLATVTYHDDIIITHYLEIEYFSLFSYITMLLIQRKHTNRYERVNVIQYVICKS